MAGFTQSFNVSVAAAIALYGVVQRRRAHLGAPGDLDEKKLSDWLGTLLRTKGQDIFRMKGVLAVKGRAMRFVFQGVHMILDGDLQRDWKDGEKRSSRIVFIGRHLKEAELRAGFAACAAKATATL